MNTMKKHLLLSLGILLVFAIAVPAGAASPPLQVNFVAPMYFPPAYGTFTATGPAFDEGLVCGTGDVVEISGRILVQNVQGMNLQIIHRFACDDGSGTQALSM
jgi:hypothetical protein